MCLTDWLAGSGGLLQVVELGSHQELMDLKGLYAAMVASHEAAPTDGQEDQSPDNAGSEPSVPTCHPLQPTGTVSKPHLPVKVGLTEGCELFLSALCSEDGPDAAFGADGDELAVSGAGGGPAFVNRRKSSVASRRMSKASSIDESRRSAGGQIMRRSV